MKDREIFKASCFFGRKISLQKFAMSWCCLHEWPVVASVLVGIEKGGVPVRAAA